MSEFDYKPNSFKAKEEQKETTEKKVEKVASGKVKKKNEAQKFASAFLSEDISNIKSYALTGVLIPAVKKAIYDIITEGIDMLLYGGSGRGKKTTQAGKVTYASYYDKRRNEDDRRYDSPRTRTAYSYDEVTVDSRMDAEEVLARMDELIEKYGMVSVADLYDLVGITGNYTDNKYGWTSLRNAEPVKTRDGYLIKLPRATPLD